METESPRGLNLHPAKQPRTTLFDCLPAGLPSVPIWTNLHVSPRVSIFSLSLSPSSRLHLIFYLIRFILSCHFVSSGLILLPSHSRYQIFIETIPDNGRVETHFFFHGPCKSGSFVLKTFPFLFFLHSDSDREEGWAGSNLSNSFLEVRKAMEKALHY